MKRTYTFMTTIYLAGVVGLIPAMAKCEEGLNGYYGAGQLYGGAKACRLENSFIEEFMKEEQASIDLAATECMSFAEIKKTNTPFKDACWIDKNRKEKAMRLFKLGEKDGYGNIKEFYNDKLAMEQLCDVIRGAVYR